MLPQDAAVKLKQHLSARGHDVLRYCKVFMKLGDLLHGDFFNQYIKTGNILMLSEGRHGIDQTFRLLNGTLRIEVDKPTHERLGLQGGKPIQSGGRKHVTARYAIDIDLRQPAMVHGKSGFERLIWACKNVLNHTVTWLFYDVSANAANDGSGPIAAFQPLVKTVEPQSDQLAGVNVPQWPWKSAEQENGEEDETIVEILEWLSLASQLSPRIQGADTIDPFLSRYRSPTTTPEATVSEQNLCRLRWYGLVTNHFALNVFLAMLKTSGEEWAAMSIYTFTETSYTILLEKDHCMTWEYND
jgi:ribonuclease P/MRP protein subunit RPP40